MWILGNLSMALNKETIWRKFGGSHPRVDFSSKTKGATGVVGSSHLCYITKYTTQTAIR